MDLEGLLYNRPLSLRARNALESLPLDLLRGPGVPRAQQKIVLEAFFVVDRASQGEKAPRELQVRCAIASGTASNVVVRAGTGYGKTMAMVMRSLLNPDAIAITVSPLRLIQQNHVEEFERWGIPSLAINADTPWADDLYKTVKAHSLYRHYAVSPEQCGIFKTHLMKFAKLIRDPVWTRRTTILNIDEPQYIYTTGHAHGSDDIVFRPAYTDLGERLRIHLPATANCAIFSASLPPHILPTITNSLRMTPETTTSILLSTNRPNLVHAVIPMIGGLDNYENLNFLIPPAPVNPSDFKKAIVFLDSKVGAANLAKHLTSRLPLALQRAPAGEGVICHYHSSMSKAYLKKVFEEFKKPGGRVRILIATESASNGVDVPDIILIIMFGVPKTLMEGDQRAGRGGRNGVECLVLWIVEAWAFDPPPPDSQRTISAKESRTDKNVIEYTATRVRCRRRFLAHFNDDQTEDAVRWCGRWCCDNDGNNFDLQSYLPSQVLTTDRKLTAPKVKKPRNKYRTKALRAELEARLRTWRKIEHSDDPVLRRFSPKLIIEDDLIILLARTAPGHFKTPHDVTTMLNETEEWEQERAHDIYTLITDYDLETRPTRKPRGRPAKSTITVNVSDSSDEPESEEIDPKHHYQPLRSPFHSPPASRPLTPVSPVSSQASSPASSPPSSPYISTSPHDRRPSPFDDQASPKRHRTIKSTALFDSTNFL